MSGALGALRGSFWSGAAAIYAWVVAVILAVVGHVGTLLLVMPPAALATVPLFAGHRQKRLAGFLVAGVLALWSVVGITLLGGYFLPGAALLAVGAVREKPGHAGP